MNKSSTIATLLCARLQSLAGKLMDAQSRLTSPDPEALHDFRVALRELRSLVQPVRKALYGADELDALAATCARPTNLLRDREVLCLELTRKGEHALHDILQTLIQEDLQDLASRQPAEALTQRLLSLTVYWEKYLVGKDWARVDKCLRKSRDKQRRRLKKALRAADTDLHRLRIWIKRYRYFLESYRSLFPKTRPELMKSIKDAQELTGNWHDRHVWIQAVNAHPELQALVTGWMDESLQLQFPIQEIRLQLRNLL
ncbi:MAG: CHAD domain-containing protein [Fluviicoccus sp.]|uniref:CHAD domain-containing protein n=1 Tax=Fluviicoccus sp. TaxID=2003552 RepID=UPI00271C1F44|nr:CHAD domain-containing protein [Fluviicoccus sp.]MDO8329167.1 CHAD domain-containing protein [Fluviicoccus sp.]